MGHLGSQLVFVWKQLIVCRITLFLISLLWGEDYVEYVVFRLLPTAYRPPTLRASQSSMIYSDLDDDHGLERRFNDDEHVVQDPFYSLQEL